MKKEAWIITQDEVFYYREFFSDCFGGAWDFTPFIDQAYQFSTEAAAKAKLEHLTSGFKDTTAFGIRKMTRKDYNEIKKLQEEKTFFRKNEQGAA